MTRLSNLFTGSNIFAYPGTDVKNYDGGLAEAVNTVGSNKADLWISNTQYVTTDINVPDNVTLHFTATGVLNVDATSTLTIYSPLNIITQETNQIFNGNGTVIFTVQNEFGYAEWWGIDGVDDETEINSALNALNKVKLLGDKTYYIGSSILLSNNGILVGEGWTTTLQAQAGLTNAIIANNGATQNAYMTVKDLKIFGNGETCESITFGASDNHNHRIENIWTDYTLDRSITISDSTSCVVTRCKVTRFGELMTADDGPVGNDGIRLTYPIDCEVSYNIVSNEDLIVTQHAANQSYGRHAITMGANPGYRNKVIFNVIRTTERMGINYEGSGGTGPSKSICAYNQIYDAGTTGILATSDYLDVSNNYIEDAGSTGIQVQCQTSDAMIICNANTIINCGADPISGGDTNGILADGTGTYKSITNNVIKGSTTHGIFLERSYGNCNGNICESNGEDGIKVGGDNWVVTNNTCDNNINDGIDVGNNTVGFTVSSNILRNNGNYGLVIGNNTVGTIGHNFKLNNSSGEENISAFYAGHKIGDTDYNKGSGVGLSTRYTELTGLAGATVTWANAIISGEMVLGVTCSVSNDITGATSFDVVDVPTVGTIDNVVSGKEALGNGDSTAVVIFETAQADDDYILNVSLRNEVDPVSTYSYTIIDKTATGFSVVFSNPMDAENYVLEWIIAPGEANSLLDTTTYLADVGISAPTFADYQNVGSNFKSPRIYTTTTDLQLVSSGGNFTGGDVRIAVHYIKLFRPKWN